MNRKSKGITAAAVAAAVYGAGVATPKEIPVSENVQAHTIDSCRIPVYRNMEVQAGELVTEIVLVNGKASIIDTIKVPEKSDLFVRYTLIGKK
jgi:hypothetical protein